MLPSSGITAAPDPLAPIAPAPGAARRLRCHLGRGVTMDADAVLHLDSTATRELLNDMLCLPARLSTSLSIELQVQPAGASIPPPAAKPTALQVSCPPEILEFPGSLTGLQSWLRVGKRRWGLLAPEGGSTALSSFDLEYLYWRRAGGGPDGCDPVYCLRLSCSTISREPGNPGSDLEGDLETPASTPGGTTAAATRGSEEAAVDARRIEKLEKAPFEVVTPPGPRVVGGNGLDERRHHRSRSRSRSRSREMVRDRRQERRHRSRSRSPRRRERSRSRSPARVRHALGGSGQASPDANLRAPLPALGLQTDGSSVRDWWVGTPCEDPGVVQHLTPPAPSTETLLFQRALLEENKDWFYVACVRKLHSDLLGMPRNRPLPKHPVRAVLLTRDPSGRVDRMVHTWFEYNRLMQWHRVRAALGDVRKDDFICFEFLGTLRLLDPGFKNARVPFFEVTNRGFLPRGESLSKIFAGGHYGPALVPASEPHQPQRWSQPRDPRLASPVPKRLEGRLGPVND